MNNQLEDYYCGNIEWTYFASLYQDFPDTQNTYALKKLMNNDLLLIKSHRK